MIINSILNYWSIWSEYIWTVAGALFIQIILIICCVSCCKIYFKLSNENSGDSKKRRYFSKEGVMYIAVFILLAVSAVAFALYSVKGDIVKDWPYIKNDNYMTVTGEVIDEGADPEFGKRTIYVQNSDGKVIKCSVGGATYEIGNVYEIIYLPYTRIGCIVRELEE